ncbi:hypothetical protein [Pseudofulvimonas gallinarii]|jgi:hypothetical protein|uniref:Choice-of-anchor D domain-containing protein n=1 Tax=Pseudofulvimonas gallinarii TaxID=634155 RepID=A0A4R3LFM7_9GAMM|nr:hypothetical protein [Pseudofulvimonas gallinarii]TCS98893.1 hypothetical protein EDC25_10790 [Pseudofulvimonas gallinarii]THD14372.1 hypothetical protein B1808_03675 [Pseudofulvimonas gallinarii]
MSRTDHVLRTAMLAAFVASPALVLAAGITPLQRADVGRMAAQGSMTFVSEDFERSMARFLDPMEFAACIEPVSSRSDDACFAPGDLADGFSIHSTHGHGVLSMGRDIIQFPSLTIGAWPYRLSPSSLNYTRVEFEHGPTVVAADVFGFGLANGSANGSAAPVTVEAFDEANNSLGSFVVMPPAFNQPAFAGFSSEVPIAAVEFGTRELGAGAQIDNLLFGGMAQAPRFSTDRLRFGAQAIGQPGEQAVEIVNPGDRPWQLDAAVVHGEGYALADDGCSGAPLPARGTCTIRIAFAPAWADTFFGRLQVSGEFSPAPLVLSIHGIGSVEEATP